MKKKKNKKLYFKLQTVIGIQLKFVLPSLTLIEFHVMDQSAIDLMRYLFKDFFCKWNS